MQGSVPVLPDVSKKKRTGKTVVFIPFEKPGNLLTGGNEVSPEYWKYGKEFVLTKTSSNLKECMSLLQNQDDVLYIVGHCSPGSTFLSNHDVLMSVTEVIMAKGLIDFLKPLVSNKFMGKIKLFACEAALPGVGKPSFASLFVTAAGPAFPNCKVFGYNNKLLRGYSVKEFDGSAPHKWAVGGTRAKLARVEFDIKTGQEIKSQ